MSHWAVRLQFCNPDNCRPHSSLLPWLPLDSLNAGIAALRKALSQCEGLSLSGNLLHRCMRPLFDAFATLPCVFGVETSALMGAVPLQGRNMRENAMYLTAFRFALLCRHQRQAEVLRCLEAVCSAAEVQAEPWAHVRRKRRLGAQLSLSQPADSCQVSFGVAEETMAPNAGAQTCPASLQLMFVGCCNSQTVCCREGAGFCCTEGLVLQLCSCSAGQPPLQLLCFHPGG